MIVITGLGNPGNKYTGTRHNVGFQVLDFLAKQYRVDFSHQGKWAGDAARAVVAGQQLILLKPDTFMNNSGRSVVSCSQYFKVPPEKILVIHDDLDLPFGRLKLAAKGGDGGHKGIRSIAAILGSREFPRLKIGIGRPPGLMPPESYVLASFTVSEQQDLQVCISLIQAAVEMFVAGGIVAAMNAFNQKNSPESPEL